MDDFISPSRQLISSTYTSISTRRYLPLCFDGIHGFSNVIPHNIRDKLPIFCGKQHDSGSLDIWLFVDLMEDFEIAYEDVHMKLFVHTLRDDARD